MALKDHVIIRCELKYCEQCGALWLRLRGSSEEYCVFCGRLHALLPARLEDNRRGWRKRNSASCSASSRPDERAKALKRGHSAAAKQRAGGSHD